jgi:serine protease Do
MQNEIEGHEEAAWTSHGSAPSTHLRPRPIGEPWNGDRRPDEEGLRLKRLLWIFTVLIIVLVAPSIIYKVEYSLTAARERARHDVARANLADFKLEQISAGYRALAQTVGPSVVNISTQRGRGEGQGSGVIVDAANGYIVTNQHVIDGVGTAEIQLSDGRSGPATVIGVDTLTDIAVLKTTMDDLVAAEWGSSDDLQVGDIVWALGSPFGLQKSITFGILSAKERRGVTGTRVIQEFLQTDAAVNPGNSGGPLVNHEGKVVGINTAIIGPSYQGISFAVPSELARASYEQIRDNGYVLRGFLGIGPDDVPVDLADELELKRGVGVLINTVAANSPAAAAGMRPYDVILTWDGAKFADPTLLSRAIAATPIGSEVPVELMRATPRGPKKLDVKVKVAARPPTDL